MSDLNELCCKLSAAIYAETRTQFVSEVQRAFPVGLDFQLEKYMKDPLKHAVITVGEGSDRVAYVIFQGTDLSDPFHIITDVNIQMAVLARSRKGRLLVIHSGFASTFRQYVEPDRQNLLGVPTLATGPNATVLSPHEGSSAKLLRNGGSNMITVSRLNGRAEASFTRGDLASAISAQNERIKTVSEKNYMSTFEMDPSSSRITRPSNLPQTLEPLYTGIDDMWNSFRTLENDLRKLESEGAKIIYTGHSLGGAIAQAYRAYHSIRSDFEGQIGSVVTFGSPLVFSRASTPEILTILGQNARHYVTPNDVVPRFLAWRDGVHGVSKLSIAEFQYTMGVKYLERISSILGRLGPQGVASVLGVAVGMAITAAASGPLLAGAALGGILGAGGAYYYSRKGRSEALLVLEDFAQILLDKAPFYVRVGDLVMDNDQDIGKIPECDVDSVFQDHTTDSYLAYVKGLEVAKPSPM